MDNGENNALLEAIARRRKFSVVDINRAREKQGSVDATVYRNGMPSYLLIIFQFILASSKWRILLYFNDEIAN